MAPATSPDSGATGPAEGGDAARRDGGAPAPSGDGSALLAPLALGPRRMANRVAFGAHLTNFGPGRTYTARHRAYYAARAAGGAALIVTEAMTVHPLDWPHEHVPAGHTDAIVPALASLREAVAAAGPDCLLLAQLNHWGGQSNGKLLRQSPWAPSSTVEVASKRMARAMEPAQIAEVVAAFAAAAGRVARAGLDGVELNAGQHGLLRQFLSPLTNFRGDDYGGLLENRLRMPVETLRAVRAALGPDRVLGLKLCGDELAPWGGLTVDDAVTIARAFAAEGLLDYLSIQIGGPYSVHMTEAGMPVPQAHAAHLAQAVREALAADSLADGRAEGTPALPVFAEGRIERPDAAEAVLTQGQADAVVMTRALVSDPDLPRKVAGLDPAPVRPHVGMLRYFSVQGDWNRPVGDLANPRAGREERLPPVVPRSDAAARPVLVVGGGPAGMEAAVTLAGRGHAVTLREAGPRLGGMAAVLAEAVASRAEFGALVAYQTQMLARLGVTVELERPVSADDPDLEDFAAICVATGAQPPPPPFEADGPVLSPRALLAPPPGAPPLPPPEAGRVAVVDGEYGFRMAGCVEWLLAHGYGVDVITDDFFVGRGLVESAEFLWFQRVAPQGLGQHPTLRAESFAGGTLRCRHRFADRDRVFAPVAFAVAAQPEVPADALATALEGRHPRVWRTGDALAPRLMGEAILAAHRDALKE